MDNTQTKRFLIFVIREMQIKMTRYYFIPTRMAIIFFLKDGITSVNKNIVKLEPLCIAGGNVKWCNCCGKQFGDSSKSYGAGDGTPLQYSCLENPMDGEAW